MCKIGLSGKAIMRILALILARGGSKRLPGKNIRILGDKPLIVWSIDIVKNCQHIADILVSTDDPSIGKIASAAGALVPWLRPQALATDTASGVDACLHALNWYEKERGQIDGLLLLQPTSPFRTRDTIRRGIDLFAASHQEGVVGVSEAATHPMWALRLEGNYVVPYLAENGLTTRSQDLPMAYAVNGSFYLVSPKQLREDRSFFGRRTTPLIIESHAEAIDIDTEWDFKFAEFILQNRSLNV
jgi:N-acylneuraminate cytidylyltransferase